MSAQPILQYRFGSKVFQTYTLTPTIEKSLEQGQQPSRSSPSTFSPFTSSKNSLPETNPFPQGSNPLTQTNPLSVGSNPLPETDPIPVGSNPLPETNPMSEGSNPLPETDPIPEGSIPIKEEPNPIPEDPNVDDLLDEISSIVDGMSEDSETDTSVYDENICKFCKQNFRTKAALSNHTNVFHTMW
jgi:hypothetical protein